MPKPISLDEVLSSRAPSVLSTKSGDIVTKTYTFKAPDSWSEESRSARFTMSAQVVDRYRDVVVIGGLDTKSFEKNPVALFNHSHNSIIGTWSDVEKTERGRKPHLDGTVNFLPEGFTDDTDKAVRLVQAGALRGASIGFMPKEYEWIREGDEYTGGIRFMASELIECSVVAVPANPAALVKAAGGDNRLALAMHEYVLDTWAKTPEGLIVPREEYERSYSVVKLSVPRPAPVAEGEDEAEPPVHPSVFKRVERMIADALATAFPTPESVALSAAAAESTEEPAEPDANVEAPPEPAAPEAKSAPTDEEIAAANAQIAALEAELALAGED